MHDDILAKGGNDDVTLAALAEQARRLPSKSWTLGVAIIMAALVVALVVLARELRELIGCI